MKIKFLTIIFLLIVFSISHVYAIDMFLTQSYDNIESTQSSETATDDYDYISSIVKNEIESEEYDDTPITTIGATNTLSFDDEESEPEVISQNIPSVTTTSVVRDNTLTVSDIISIILIALCIVLILLAIAILIRCK